MSARRESVVGYLDAHFWNSILAHHNLEDLTMEIIGKDYM